MERREKEPYQEPLLVKHEPLRDLTGQKYGEKIDKTSIFEKAGIIDKTSIAEN